MPNAAKYVEVRPGRVEVDFDTDAHGDGDHCVRCGRALRTDFVDLVHQVDGGGYLCPVDEQYDNDAADLGWWTVGPECARLLPAGYTLREQRRR